MKEELEFDLVVLLLLFGVYFVIEFYSTRFIPELLYGFSLIFYFFKCTIIRKRKCIKKGIK